MSTARRIFEELFHAAGLDPDYSFSEGYAAIQNGTAALVYEDRSAVFCSSCRDFRAQHLLALPPHMGEYTLIILPERYTGGSPLTCKEVLREAVCVVRRGKPPTLIGWSWFDTDNLHKVAREEAESAIFGP